MAKQISPSKGSRFDPLSVLWRAAAAPWTLMGLVGLLALALALGSLIPQIPSQAVDDPQAWLAVQSGIFGQRNGLVRALGLFDLYHAFWFRLLLVLIGLALFVWLVESVELAWRATKAFSGEGQKSWAIEDLALWGSRTPRLRLSSSLSLDEVQTRTRHILVQHHYRCTDVSDQPSLNWVAGHRALFLWARPLVYGALLVILIALAIVAGWGWQSEDWRPAPGDSQAVGHGLPYAVRLDAFDLQMGEDGQLLDYRSQIAWLADGSPVAQDEVGPGQPATFQGVAVRQVGYVPEVKMRGWDDANRQLALQVADAASAAPGETEVIFSSPEAQPLVLVPSLDLFLVLSFERLGAEGRPALRVDLVSDGGTNRQPLGVLYESGSLVAKGMRLRVNLAYRPILRLDYRPAMAVVLVGGALAVAALAVAWIASPRLLWVTAGAGEENLVVVRVVVPAGLKGSRWISQLGDQLRGGLADGA